MSTRELTPLPFAATIEVRDACLCLHVQRAARALARKFDEALRPLDLTNGQFSLLTSLNRPEPPAMGSVAADMATYFGAVAELAEVPAALVADTW